ncbi:SH3 domain-containing protein [Nocardia jejuensis]|uniref:SH3 domain-containing protein n=1 Tax=Nocardia jejuensis TaxID=328049 RepID=UPI0008307B7E|nr:SH3 domain-containing protein [Nocardia jejuensis]
MKTRILLAAALTAGSTGISAFLGTPVAQAQQACNWTVNTGTTVARDTTVDGPYSSYNLYSGNSTSCSKTGATVVQGLQVKIYCWQTNDAGNAWAWIQAFPGTKGWISRSNLGSYTAVAKC